MKKVVLQKLLLVLVVCVVLCDVGLGAIATRIDGIIGQKAYAKVQFGICVVKAEDGEVVYNRNANKAMVPASNMKIVTSAAALRYLGADHEYKTEVGLVGDKLIVTGSGDPLLGDKKIDSKYGRKSGWVFARKPVQGNTTSPPLTIQKTHLQHAREDSNLQPSDSKSATLSN